MYFYIFTGPCAAGKNTIATLLARSAQRGVHIDVDRLRAMVVQPHKAPWDGEEGKAQQRLAIENSCLLAKRFIREGYSVTITNLLSDSTARLYKELLRGISARLVRLWRRPQGPILPPDVAYGRSFAMTLIPHLCYMLYVSRLVIFLSTDD